jgi:hypothetical protein
MPISTLHLPELSLSLHPYASPNDQPILLSQTLSRTIKRLERQGVCITTLSSPPVPSLYPSPPSTAVISFTVSRSSPWILSPEHDMYIHSPSLSPIARPEPFTVSLIPPALLVQLMLATPASEAAGNGKQMQNSGMEKLLREIAVQTETEHVEKGKEMQKVLLVVGLEEYLAEEVGSVEKSLFRKRLLGGWLRERCFLNEGTLSSSLGNASLTRVLQADPSFLLSTQSRPSLKRRCCSRRSSFKLPTDLTSTALYIFITYSWPLSNLRFLRLFSPPCSFFIQASRADPHLPRPLLLPQFLPSHIIPF